jgi:squalene-hopene/tetraprenyl-beta-curcumene cyclase
MERSNQDSNLEPDKRLSPIGCITAEIDKPPQDHIWRSIEAAWDLSFDYLRSQQTADGHWIGQLSTSALSTATAISALVQVKINTSLPPGQSDLIDAAIEGGCIWLANHQNNDGGWGDTDRSYSNIATTLLVIAAMRLAHGEARDGQAQILSAWRYVDGQGRWDGLRRRYGKDKTFVVPILSNCALAGLVPWSDVSALPFEAAWLPQRWYRLAKMPVVSYAVPALVAIGQARFHFAPPGLPPLRWLRRAAIEPTLRVLARMQPASGGYLEATPLTSFVLMNLAAIGKGDLPVALSCLRFLLDARLEDGSWPIDTNLATWGTSLAWHALSRRRSLSIEVDQTTSASKSQHQPARLVEKAKSKEDPDGLDPHSGFSISRSGLQWLIGCQHRQHHPFTGATPGGWGWTDLSGAVPDADDTPAALLALSYVDWQTVSDPSLTAQVLEAVGMGLDWLVRLQNRDGGWPTFCRGWGTLPFDRSGTDLTAHALRAIRSWQAGLDRVHSHCPVCPTQNVLNRAVDRGLRFLMRTQRSDGSWLPLWFGNQDRTAEDNPFYGTGKVLLALAKLDLTKSKETARGVEFLKASQNPDGGWGGSWQSANSATNKADKSSTIEESAVVLEGLIACSGQMDQDSTIMCGLEWIAKKVNQGGLENAQPIGFYFAKLWYYEKLYPALFGLSALGAALRQRDESHQG